MPQIKSRLSQYYLKPGEMFMMEKPALISTVLGSCIAVTLYNKRLGFAGICHALLPHCKRKNYRNKIEDLLDDECHKCSEAFKYADCSVSMMAEAFFRFGITPEETEVRLFGGATMMSNPKQSEGNTAVGHQNVTIARKVIADCRLVLASFDVGGTVGRKIIFNTKTGEVLHQYLKNNIFSEPGEKVAGRAKSAGRKRP